jgi:hypothetical protein
MSLQQLEDAARVLERRIAEHEAVCAALIVPRGLVVCACGLVETREETVVEAVAIGHDERRVGVELDIVVVEEVLAQDFVDPPPPGWRCRSPAGSACDDRPRPTFGCSADRP